MLFNSLQFLIFFPIVVLIYYIIPSKYRHIWLLAASYYFYMCWNVKYIILLLLSTIITYLCGLYLEHFKQLSPPSDNMHLQAKKNLCIAIGFTLNLCILFLFKYFNFITDNLQQLFSFFHIKLNCPDFDLLLPVGISFYTFQALSYTMDVYRDDIHAEKNFIRYALFVSFFPQLVAGPIERSTNLLKQLRSPNTLTWDSFREGILLMLWGYFLKVVLADRIAIFVDTVYGGYTNYPGMYLTIATLLFSVQIYCDFGGYSTIAMGTARILGIELMDNFNAPYLSSSVSEFWRRWHISLSSWFRDYLYIPLGGNRKGSVRKNLNLMIVFLVSGLWHGAQWTYVIWGGLNGIYQIIGNLFHSFINKWRPFTHSKPDTFSNKLLHILFTFVLIDFSWIFFRAENLSGAISIIKSIFTEYNPWILFDGSLYQCGLNQKNFTLMLLGIFLLLLADIGKYFNLKLSSLILRQEYWMRWLIIAIFICVILLFGIWGTGYNEANFIYFQF